MKTCPKCKAPCPRTAKRCEWCGTAFKGNEASSQGVSIPAGKTKRRHKDVGTKRKVSGKADRARATKAAANPKAKASTTTQAGSAAVDASASSGIPIDVSDLDDLDASDTTIILPPGTDSERSASKHQSTSAPPAKDGDVVEMMMSGDNIRRVEQDTLLARQFRVLDVRPVGAGGMGEVWRALDTELDAIIAVKVISPRLTRDENALATLRHEALIGRQLAHPNICKMYGLHSDGEMKFIVMEYVPGRTLKQLLQSRRGNRLSWKELEPIARQVAAALDSAHTTSYIDSVGRDLFGLVHGDVKPGNIMIRPDGAVRLMDFGISRHLSRTANDRDRTVKLTPLYASPEQFRGADVDRESDIYSLAAVFYECLVGQPFVSPKGDLKSQVLIREFEPSDFVPKNVNRALAAGLAKHPEDRPESATALVDRISAGFAGWGFRPTGWARRATDQPKDERGRGNRKNGPMARLAAIPSQIKQALLIGILLGVAICTAVMLLWLLVAG